MRLFSSPSNHRPSREPQHEDLPQFEFGRYSCARIRRPKIARCHAQRPSKSCIKVLLAAKSRFESYCLDLLAGAELWQQADETTQMHVLVNRGRVSVFEGPAQSSMRGSADSHKAGDRPAPGRFASYCASGDLANIKRVVILEDGDRIPYPCLDPVGELEITSRGASQEIHEDRHAFTSDTPTRL